MVLNCNINQAIYILLEMPDWGHSVPCVCSTVRGVCIISFQGLVYCSQCTVAKGSKVGQQLAEHKTNTQWANSISPLPTPIYCGVDEVGAAEARKERSICAGSRHSANPARLYLESLFFFCLFVQTLEVQHPPQKQIWEQPLEMFVNFNDAACQLIFSATESVSLGFPSLIYSRSVFV